MTSFLSRCDSHRGGDIALSDRKGCNYYQGPKTGSSRMLRFNCSSLGKGTHLQLLGAEREVGLVRKESPVYMLILFAADHHFTYTTVLPKWQLCHFLSVALSEESELLWFEPLSSARFAGGWELTVECPKC